MSLSPEAANFCARHGLTDVIQRDAELWLTPKDYWTFMCKLSALYRADTKDPAKAISGFLKDFDGFQIYVRDGSDIDPPATPAGACHEQADQ